MKLRPPPWLLPFIAVGVALLLCALLIAIAGQNPLAAGAALWKGAVGVPWRSPLGLSESLAKTIPLIMTGLGVAIAFRAGFFNVGAEGQFIMGAVAAVALANRMEAPVPLVLIGGAVAGALWALIAGVLKAWRHAPEIITTIMLNYVALYIMQSAVQGPLQQQDRQMPQSDVLPAAAQLPALIPHTNLHAGLIVALIAVAACWWLLFRTGRGFLLRATGANPVAARAAGIATTRTMLASVALAGGLCGLGGAMEVAGATKQIGLFGFEYGYTAIAVALLGDLNPLGIVPAALLFGMLGAGGGAMERQAHVPAVTVSIVIGVVVFIIAAMPKLRLRVVPA